MRTVFQEFFEDAGGALAEWQDRCERLCSDVGDWMEEQGRERGRQVRFYNTGTPLEHLNGHLWRHHRAILVDSLVHCAWADGPMEVAEYVDWSFPAQDVEVDLLPEVWSMGPSGVWEGCPTPLDEEVA